MDRIKNETNEYPDDAFNEIIIGIKGIDIPKIEFDRKKVMREIVRQKSRHGIWRYLAPVVWSYLTISAFYFFYYFRNIISNIFLYYAESKLKWMSQFLIKLVKLVSLIPNEVLVVLFIVPTLSLILVFVFKLVLLSKNPQRRKYEKIF